MNRTLSFIHLEFITIKPYLTLKNLGLLLCVMILLSLTSGNGIMIASMCTMYGVMYSSYPFALGEKNNVDYLYPTLAISRKRVVMGRYLFSLFMLIGFSAAGLALACASNLIAGSEISLGILIAVTGALLLCGILIMSFQLPLYFKLGYSKARLLSFLPLIVLPTSLVTFSTIYGGGDAAAKIFYKLFSIGVVPLCLIVTGAVLLIYYLSCKLSARLYLQRDL